MSLRHFASALLCTAVSVSAFAQFSGFHNKGLVGVARIPANTIDKTGQDTLGGLSGLTIVPDRNPTLPWKPSRGRVYYANLLAISDRGFGDGTRDYKPRLQQFRMRIRPVYGNAPQNEFSIENTATKILTYGVDTPFTGFDADPENNLSPISFRSDIHIGDFITPLSLQRGRRSIDPEGVTRDPDGSLWISDEYAPAIYHFTRDGELIKPLEVPNAVVPKSGPAFGQRKTDFAASALTADTGEPDTGRRDDRGFAGISATADGKRLVAVLQAPLVQDSGSDPAAYDTAVNTRIVVWDVDPKGRENFLTAEYVYQLETTAGSDGVHQTTLGDVFAINDHQFLVIENDTYGRGSSGDNAVKPSVKRIVLVDASAATNIYRTGYDKELGADGQLSLPHDRTALNGVVPVTKFTLIDLTDAADLARFGLNSRSGAESDANSLGEKMEGLTLISLNDPNAPDDYLLFVVNDNDFKATHIVQNGVEVGSSPVNVDTIFLAYRLTLPGLAK